MTDPTQPPSKKLSRIEPYRSKDGVRAHVFPSRLGGDDIVIIEADTAAGENAEVVLNVAEVASLRDWLSKASPASSDEPETAPHSGDHLQRFTAWLAKEMPSGTEIADPYWWAPKILAAACVTADEMPSQPPRAIPFAGVVQGVNYEALANATNPPEPEIVPGEFDLAFEIMRLMDNKELDTLQSCHFGYVLRVTREGATQPPGAWQLIESLQPTQEPPTFVIIAEPKPDGSYVVGEARYFESGWRWAGNDPSDHWGREVYPTHWMPLPSPPTKCAGQS
jgi:hypothetical protein